MSRLGVVLALFTLLPGMVFAHATPVEMTPDSGENVPQVREISIRFSERLESASSRIRVTNQAGSVVSAEARVSDSPFILTAPITATEDGVYTVSWSVVSKDDGHFTKGAYAFAIGSSTVASVSDSSVVKLTSWKEVSAIFVEFLGNSVLWGVLVLLVFAIRPVISQYTEFQNGLRRIVLALSGFGVVAGVLGAAAQILIKGSELALLHAISFADAVAMYLHTASGESTLFRAAALIVFGVLVSNFRSRLLEAGITWRDGVLAACLLAFAYFRATISHATANPFFPELSIFINTFHLIDKDLWLGIVLVVSVLLLVSRTDLVRAIIPRAFSILAMNLAFISLTASYIVWLHLRDFGNLTTTEWGENFLTLLTAAFMLVGLRTYHVLAYAWYPSFFARWLRFTIPFETVAAGLVVFFTSLVIITSPPAHAAHGAIFVQKGESAIRLERSPSEDDQALITVRDERAAPIVRIGEGEGALLAPVSQRFHGGYVVPLALLQGVDTAIEIIVPQRTGYDARAVFYVTGSDFEPRTGHGRTFDMFAIIMLLVAFSGLLFGGVLERVGNGVTVVNRIVADRLIVYAVVGGLLAFFAAWFLILGVERVFPNKFKAACVADGNMWHMMQPMKAGTATSKTPREGCMLSSGTYHIPDHREYEYLRSLGPAEVAFVSSPEKLRPGIPAQLQFKLTEADGSPAKLSIEHEKILHVIVIGADMQSFAHIHADDDRSLTREEITGSTFTLNHTFPKAGEYIVAVDYLHGLVHESRQFRVQVGPEKPHAVTTYASPGSFNGYDVEFAYTAPLVGDVATIRYTVRKDGVPVTDLVPYLGAAMHVAIVKNDLSEFIHTHGEVHPPGYVAPTNLKNHQHTPPPAQFGPIVEAHAVFPSPGLYTVFGEFKDANGAIVATRFTVRVE